MSCYVHAVCIVCCNENPADEIISSAGTFYCWSLGGQYVVVIAFNDSAPISGFRARWVSYHT